MVAEYEVWSITTANRYRDTFTDLESAREVLRKAYEIWPDDEFGILCRPDDGEPYIVEEDDRREQQQQRQHGGEG